MFASAWTAWVRPDRADHQSTNAVDPPTPVPGYPATTGSDPVTGLGTPNAANLIPDLVAAVHGH